MTKIQLLIMWIFGLLVCVILYLGGAQMNDYNGNIFVAILLPIIIIGTLFFISFKRRK